MYTLTDPDWSGDHPAVGEVVFGKDVEVGEGVIINRPAATPDGTVIGDHCHLMSGCFVGHDTVLGSHVTLNPRAVLAGFVTIGDYSTIGMNASVHQHSKLGRCCMIGANCFFKGESPDGVTWVGVPARPLKVNTVGIQRAFGLSDIEKHSITESAKLFVDHFKRSGNV